MTLNSILRMRFNAEGGFCWNQNCSFCLASPISCFLFMGLFCYVRVVEELTQLCQTVWPMTITGFVLYSRSIVSMLFLGCLGHAELACGSLAIAFANITGYSALKGLSMGMEPICSQAFGARKMYVLAHAFQRTFLSLLLSTIPITLLWINMGPILLRLGQDHEIVSVANHYILFSLPDLLLQACLHPLTIFLRTQGLTRPLTLSAALALFLHVPINCFLVPYLGLGVRGVALASACNTITTNLGLTAYMFLSDTAIKPWDGFSLGSSFNSLGPLVALTVPSAASVCLEWWWYEVMLLLCGLLPDAQTSIAAMGILIHTTGIIYVLPSSLSMGLSTRVGHKLGAYKPDGAQLATAVGLTVAGFCGLSAFLFTLAVRHVWGSMFTREKGILALTSAALPIVGFCELGNCPQTAGCGVLRGSARPATGANINFCSFYLIGLPVAIVASFMLELGFLELWLGLVAAQASCACFMLYAVARTDWEVQAGRAEELTGAAGAEKDDMESSLLR